MGTVVGILVVLAAGAVIWLNLWLQKFDDPAAKKRAAAAKRQAVTDQRSQLVCPHCQTKGSVTAQRAKRRRRLSVTRVVSAGVTLGASLPVAGTSKKNVVTEMHCSNCAMTWDVV